MFLLYDGVKKYIFEFKKVIDNSRLPPKYIDFHLKLHFFYNFLFLVAGVTHAAFSPDGDTLATCGNDARYH